MKKLIKTALIICMLIILVLPAALAAQGEQTAQQTFATASDLYQYWQSNKTSSESNPYPAYVCGVYTTDNGVTLTFALTADQAGQAGKAEILSMIDNDSTAAFATGKYSYAQLLAVQIQLEQYLGGSAGVNSLGIDEMQNKLIVGFSDIQSDAAKALILEYENRFRDMISFEQVGMATPNLATEATVGDAPGSQQSTFTLTDKLWLVIIAIAAVVILVVGIPMLKRKPEKKDER